MFCTPKKRLTKTVDHVNHQYAFTYFTLLTFTINPCHWNNPLKATNNIPKISYHHHHHIFPCSPQGAGSRLWICFSLQLPVTPKPEKKWPPNVANSWWVKAKPSGGDGGSQLWRLTGMFDDGKFKSLKNNKSLGLYCWHFMWNGETWMGTLSSTLLSLQMLACDSLPAIIRVNDVVVMFQAALSVEGKFLHPERTPWLPKRSITSLWKKTSHICILGSLNYVPEIIWFFLDTSCFLIQHPMTTACSPSMKSL